MDLEFQKVIARMQFPTPSTQPPCARVCEVLAAQGHGSRHRFPSHVRQHVASHDGWQYSRKHRNERGVAKFYQIKTCVLRPLATENLATWQGELVVESIPGNMEGYAKRAGKMRYGTESKKEEQRWL
eukprot:gene16182-biopygen8230